MRIFLGTNVLAGGFRTRGLSADVVRLLLAEHVWLVMAVSLVWTHRLGGNTSGNTDVEPTADPSRTDRKQLARSL